MYTKNLSRIFCAVLSAFTLTTASLTVGQIRVLPVGDAVVLGTGSSSSDVGGFRDDLNQFLNANTLPFDFVGSLDDGVSVDPDHEGYAGTSVADLNLLLANALQQHRPHMVLLHLGTEDLALNADVNTVLAGLSTTIDLIDAYSSETEIYLASLIPSKNFTVDLNVTSLNAQLAALAQSKKNAGVNLTYIDVNEVFKLNPGWQASYMSSDLFPNDLGYGIMAQSFLNSITTQSNYIDQGSFSDNFDNRFLLGPHWNTHPKFKIKTGELENSSTQEVWNNQLAMVNSIPNPNTIAYRFSPNSDEVGVAETGAAILMDAATTEGNGYLVTINSGLLRLFELNAGSLGANVQNSAVASGMPQPGDRLAISWRFENQTLNVTVNLNDVPYASLSYGLTPPGANDVRYAGVLLRGGRNNNIDDFYLSNEVDEIRPAAVVDLTLEQISATVAQFSFSATGDDSLTDAASSYDFRYATFPINALNFGQATPVTMAQAPGDPGTVESLFIAGLIGNSDYHFALTVKDENGNESALSNVVQGKTLETLSFADNFDQNVFGSQWLVSPDLEIQNNAVKTSNGSATWSSTALLKSPTSPVEAGFRWVEGGDVENTGLLMRMDNASLNASGYLIRRNNETNALQLWTVVNGALGLLIDSFDDGLANPSAGSILRVLASSDVDGHHFAVFINNVFYGLVSDANKVQGNAAVQYSGFMMRGNTGIGVDNFFTQSMQTAPASLTYASGDGQEGNLYQFLPQPLVVEVSDDQGAPVYHGQVQFEVIQGDAAFMPVTHPGGTIFIEGEAGVVDNPMIVAADSSASGGAYVVTPADSGNGGSVTYTFYVPEAGDYRIWSRVIASSGTGDSFFLQVDSNEEIVWDVLQGQHQSQWAWDQVAARGTGTTTTPEVDPYEVYLTQGSHTVLLKRRDPGTKLDKMILTKDPFFLPTGFGGGEFFASDFSGLAAAYLSLGKGAGEVIVRATVPTLPGSEVLFSLLAHANPATNIVEVSGNNQTGTAGFPLPDPFVVLVTDDYGNPVVEHPVSFEITEGSGRFVGSDSVLTDAQGHAAVTLVLSSEDPGNRVLAHGAGLIGTPVEFNASATSGIATKVVYVSGTAQTGVVAEPLPNPFAVQILDEQDDPIPGYPVRFENLSALGGSLAADSAFADANGIARMTMTLGETVGAYSAQARVDGLENSPLQFEATAIAGVAARLVKVSGDSSAGVNLLPLASPLVALVTDAFGNPVAGESVTFKVLAGGGFFAGGATEFAALSDSAGLSAATPILGSEFGEFKNQIQAEKAGMAGSPLQFVATSLPPTAYKIEILDGDRQLGIAGKALDQPLRVRVLNPIDAPIQNHPVTFEAVAGGGQFVDTFDSRQTVATDNQGIAAVSFRLGAEIGELNNVVLASASAGLNPLVGSPITFMASAKNEATKIVAVKGNNQMGVVNSPLSELLEIRVLNAEGQAIAGHPVSFRILQGGGRFGSSGDSLVVVQTNASGTASISLTLGPNSGLNNNIIEVVSSDGFAALDGSPLTFQATATTTRATSLQSLDSTQRSGIVGKQMSEPVRVRVLDNLSVPVAAHEVTFRIIAGNGRIPGAAGDSVQVVTTNANGIAEVNWILGTQAGDSVNQMEVLTGNGITELTNSPLIFTAEGLADLTDPNTSTVTSNTPVEANGSARAEVVVTLLDKYGNPISGKEIRLFATGQLNFFEQPVAATDENGRTVGYLTSIKSQDKIVSAKNITDDIVLNLTTTVTFAAITATRVSVAAGNEQSRNAGTVLSTPFVVSITDAFGNPVKNHPIHFSSKTVGGRIVEAQPVFTDSLGFASSHYVLSETPGINFAEAMATDLEGSPLLFSATGEVNEPASMLSHDGNNQLGVVGDTLANPLVVQVLDANSNPVKGVAVDYRFSTGAGEFVGSSRAFTDETGLASVRAILGNELVPYIILASSNQVPGSTVLFVVDPASAQATQMSIHAGDFQNIGVLEQSQAMTVEVRDGFNNPVEGAQIRFEIIDGEGMIIGGDLVASNRSGLASSILLAKAQSGTIQVKASLVSNPGIYDVFVIEVHPASASSFVLLSGDGQVGTAGYFTSEPLRAQIVDVYGNPVPNESVSFVVASGDAAIIGDPIRVTDNFGIVHCEIRIGSATGPVEVFAIAANVANTVLRFHIDAIENRIPVIASDLEDRQINEEETFFVDFSAIDPDGDSLRLAVQGIPEGANLTQENNQAWRFSWTPNYEQSGTYHVVFTLTDGLGGLVQDSLKIDVLNVNRLPVVTHMSPPGDTTLIHGQDINFSVDVLDPDEDVIEIKWYRNGVFVIESGSYEYLADNDFTGSDLIEVFITDLVDTLHFKWTITINVSVELVQLSAVADQAGQFITINWRTRSESDNLGFDVMRSTLAETGYRKINENLLPAQGNGEYTYVDEQARAGINYYYKIVDRSVFGMATEHGPIQAQITLPTEFRLEQSYPNPFSLKLGHEQTRISFQIPKEEIVKVQIYNVLGQLVHTIVDEQYTPGVHKISWDGRDSQGTLVTSGRYYYRFTAGDFQDIQRLVIIR